MAGIAIVADSTCDIGPAGLSERNVTMVPLKVHIGDDTFLDWVDFTPETYYPKLIAESKNPTTSQPSPKEFADVYATLAAQGADGIVVITISEKLSGTYESAILAAKDSTVPVRVVDSTFVSGTIGLVVDEACAARDAGGDLDTVEAAAQDAVRRADLFFVLDTLDYLVRGGRAGKAQGLAASLLNIKPVLRVHEGVIVPFKKVKGSRKAYQEMAAHTAEVSRASGPLKVVLVHAQGADLARQMASDLKDAGLVGEIVRIDEIGSVIGTHVGPGAVGVCFVTKG
jgi:DegV family protein with EDD domain